MMLIVLRYLIINIIVLLWAARLTYNNGAIKYLVRGHFQIKGGGTLPDPAGGVVMASVARAIVASELPGVGDGHAAQVGAHTDDHKPRGVLDPHGIGLGVTQLRHRYSILRGNFRSSPENKNKRLIKCNSEAYISDADTASGKYQHILIIIIW